MFRLLRRTLGRRAGPWATLLLVWDLWQRVPPKHRRRILGQARRHGPRVVRQMIARRRRRRF